MKKWFEQRWFVGLLTGYFILQLLSLFMHQIWVYAGYEILFLIALIQGSTISFLKAKETASMKAGKSMIGALFLFNLVLTLIYIPALLLNPAINWTLNGENEMDPMILLVFFPLAHFFLGSLMLLLVSFIGKSLSQIRIKKK